MLVVWGPGAVVLARVLLGWGSSKTNEVLTQRSAGLLPSEWWEAERLVLWAGNALGIGPTLIELLARDRTEEFDPGSD